MSLQPTPTPSFTAPLPTCTTAIPDPNGHVPPDACNANYGFYPSFTDNLAFAIAFGLTAVAHTAQAAVLRKPFCWVLIMGALWETCCFILRALGARDQQESLYVVVSTLLFLLAPLWINAFVYMLIARLIHFLTPNHRTLGVSARWLSKVFILADVLAFVIQGAGGSMMADQHDRTRVSLGQKIYMAGVAVQMAFVLAFLAVTVSFYRNLLVLDRQGKVTRRNSWTRPLIWAVMLTLILIMIRIIFRMVEFGQGVSSSNVLLQHEEFQLYLDALPMLLALFLFNFIHPGIVLQGPESSIPSKKWQWPGRARAFEPLAMAGSPESTVELTNRSVT